MKHLLILLFISTIQLTYAQSTEELQQKAESLFKAESYKKALSSVNQALEKGPTNPELFSLQARCLLKLKKFQEAYDAYTKGISTHTKSALLYNERGGLLYTTAQFDYAIRDYNQAINYAKHDSSKCEYINNRASSKMNKRDFNGAYKDLKMAYAIDSTHLGTLTNLGVVCDEVGRGEETLGYLLKVVELNPDFYPAYVNIGFKYQLMGEYAKSITFFDKALEMKPEEPLSYNNRGYNKLKLGDLKGAMQDVEKSISLYPENPYAYRNRALIHLAKGKTKKVCSDLETAIEKGFTERYGDEVLELQEKHCK